MGEGLEAVTSWEGSRARVALVGEVDAGNVDYVEHLIDGLIDTGCTEIVIDAEGITFIDTVGARALHHTWRKVSLQIINPSLRARRMLELMELDDLLLVWEAPREESGRENV